MWVVLAALYLVQHPSDSLGGATRREADATAAARTISAARGDRAPVLDGRLDDEVWTRATVATNFTQNYPRDGAPSAARTEARVLFFGDALYVGMRAFDHPDSIVAPLSRRDVFTTSDYLDVLVDTFHDRRSAFQFTVNPAGVKLDTYHYDDTQVDRSWDAVWDVAVARDSLGWTAEFRIPLSQLRYNARRGTAVTWGLNFYRNIARTQEWSSWAPIPQGEERLVSRFGDLTGIEGLTATRRREIVPFVSSSVTRAPGDTGNPLFKPTAIDQSAGLDAKLGLARGLTLDLTVHPDFGQVEADPSEVNLSGFETTFTEKRPFFVENGGLFQLPIYESNDELLFYPRRIGRSPQLSADERGGFVRAPQQTPILGAAKISGKTSGGWSIGILDAVTDAAYAEVRDSIGGSHRDLVEPRTNYGVLRLQKDLRAGRSAIGGMLTATNRTGLEGSSSLHASAYSGALDFRHRFGGASGADYRLFGALFASTVRGSRESIVETQLSSAHRFQRPDAHHLHLDSTRTSLSGYGGRLQFDKSAGRFRFGNALYSRNPGFEVNDIGIQRNADWTEDFVWIGAVETRPNRLFNNWSAYANTWSWWTTAGERTFSQANVDLNFELRNFWGSFVRLGRRFPAHTLRLRGGPLFAEDGAWLVNGNFYSPQQKAFRAEANYFVYRSDTPGITSLFLTPTFTWQPSSRVAMVLGPNYSREKSGIFYVAEASTSGAPKYVLGAIDRTTLSLTTRLDYTFTPTLTLQLYAQPFISAASYDDFKQVASPRAAKYEDRFSRLDARRVADAYEADTNGDGVADIRFDDPAFNVKEFRSNAIMRWEYRPGSTVFVVWSQGRHRSDDARFRVSRDAADLFRTVPANVLLVKVTRWLSW